MFIDFNLAIPNYPKGHPPLYCSFLANKRSCKFGMTSRFSSLWAQFSCRVGKVKRSHQIMFDAGGNRVAIPTLLLQSCDSEPSSEWQHDFCHPELVSGPQGRCLSTSILRFRNKFGMTAYFTKQIPQLSLKFVNFFKKSVRNSVKMGIIHVGMQRTSYFLKLENIAQ